MERETVHLTLAPLRSEDCAAGCAIFLCDSVKQTYLLPDFPDEAAAAELYFRMMELSHTAGRYVWGIYLSGTLIGFLNETAAEGSSIEIGYVIHPAYQGRGYATAALQEAIARLEAAGFTQIVCEAFEENRASLRVMEKCSMTYRGSAGELIYRGKKHRLLRYVKEN